MITHYLKVALRNLLKYKTQSAISTLGLAVGFVCFALSALWIRYEMTYDSANKDARRMYILYRKDILNQAGYSTFSSYPMSTLLKEAFPEVEFACAFNRWPDADIESEEGNKATAPFLVADSCFMDMFHISVAAGSMDFMYTDEKVALTRDMAMQLFGTTDVLGRKVKTSSYEKTVCAILDNLEHSNFSFGFWGDGAYFHKFLNDWSNSAYHTVIKLREGTDPEQFQKKMQDYAQQTTDRDAQSLKAFRLMPLTRYHYAHFNEEKTLEFSYLVFFSVVGLLVILCSLLNYLSLFSTRMHMRAREIGLRKVCGSSAGSLFALFATEYLSVILLAGFVGMMLIELVRPAFQAISMVKGNVYGEGILYFGFIALFSLLLLLPFVRRNPRPSYKGSRNAFRQVGIFCQLAVGILFIFCISVIMKQLYHLNHADLGWERKNIAAFRYLYSDRMDELGDRIARLPCTEEVLTGHASLFPKGSALSVRLDQWDGKQDSVPPLDMECITEGETLIRFYGLKLLEGEMIKPDDKNRVLLNESAVKALGMVHPIGKHISNKFGPGFTIIGVIKDFHTTPPTVPVPPIAFLGERGMEDFRTSRGTIVVKFHEGKWDELSTKVNELLEKDFPEIDVPFINVEETYNEYLESEKTLLKLLSFMAVVCFLVSLFGIFSFMALTCEQRQKEIAIRKINGATVKDILMIFAKEYFVLLTASAALAFPIGYALMKHWLETYIEQTEISAWIFIGIYGLIAGVIAASIGWRVWRTANENPAEVIKNE